MNRISLSSLVILLSSFCLLTGCSSSQPVTPDFQYDHGAIVRGSTETKTLALIFTGDEHGEGTPEILDDLKKTNIKASFFVTGNYLRTDEYIPFVNRIISEGHYLGPHSDAHLLYCPWEDRSKTLVTESEFKDDLARNIKDLRRFGALRHGKTILFIPPFEWFNEEQVEWSKEMGVTLFNYTPGSGSNRDWAPEGHRSFVPSDKIYEAILAYEARQEEGLNGFILLLHLGSQRKDKMHPYVGKLIEELQTRGYSFVRIDELLSTNSCALSGVTVSCTATCLVQSKVR